MSNNIIVVKNTKNLKMDFINEMYKIKLIENSKKPIACSWKVMRTTKPIAGNYGLLTGEINNITVVDIDFYDKNQKKFDFENSPFLKKFGLKTNSTRSNPNRYS